MKRPYYFLLAFFFVLFFQLSRGQIEILSKAESSDYIETANYEEVLQVVNNLDKASEFIKVENIATTTEGRKVPMMIVANPMPENVSDLKDDERIVVYIQANIHAGEVEGKEAAIMLARDLLKHKGRKYLNDAIVLICPNLNADGNEKMSENNRKHQNGPKSVGIRYNGQNLDLNRDVLKLESPEMQGVVQNVLNKWDPAITLDCHTTNGSYHEEPITFTWMMNPNGDRALINYMRDKMMPWVNQQLFTEYNTLNCFYGEFIDRLKPEKGWISYAAEPRYMINYIGVRNRLAILNENYVYADYKSRVLGCYNLMWAVLDYAVENMDEVKQLLVKADHNTIDRNNAVALKDSFALKYEGVPTPKPVTILAYEAEYTHTVNGWKRYRKTDRKMKVTVPYIADYFASESIAFPKAYVFSRNIKQVQDLLDLHGIKYSFLKSDTSFEVEEFVFSKISPSKRLNQGHYTNEIEGAFEVKEKVFQKGSIIVHLNQPLANLAAYLLEAQSDDSLLKWNFFDRYIVPQWGTRYYPYPVYRIIN